MDRTMLDLHQALVAGGARSCALSGHGYQWRMRAATNGSTIETGSPTTKRPPRRLGMRLT